MWSLDLINALASASDLKTTPPTDKEPPLADRKRRGKSDACQCVIYMNFHSYLPKVVSGVSDANEKFFWITEKF